MRRIPAIARRDHVTDACVAVAVRRLDDASGAKPLRLVTPAGELRLARRGGEDHRGPRTRSRHEMLPMSDPSTGGAFGQIRDGRPSTARLKRAGMNRLALPTAARSVT
jgi:hypothetical protein